MIPESFFKLFGGAFAAGGLAHFAAPAPFEAISRPFFGADTPRAVKINGASETAIGLAIAYQPTRVLGFAGLAAYGVYLGDRIVAYGRRRISGGSA